MRPKNILINLEEHRKREKRSSVEENKIGSSQDDAIAHFFYAKLTFECLFLKPI